MIGATLAPWIRDTEEARIVLAGPDVVLPVRMVTPIGLMIHELATNAAKYGALSAAAGRVTVGWEIADGGAARKLVLRWKESGGPAFSFSNAPPPGFGSRLVELAAQQVGGSVRREWEDDGAAVRLECPLP